MKSHPQFNTSIAFRCDGETQLGAREANVTKP